ncbi:MAG: GAF domain-containing protein [Bacteroidota bacterium]
MEAQLENKRLKNLYHYDILDTPPDGAYDEITLLATKIFNVPIAIISLVDSERVWFKSSYGVDAEEVPRYPGMCSSAVMSDDIYIVEDARKDPRTMAHPLVAGIMGFQFYAAAPLKSLDGYNLGTFCIIDKEPRTLTIKEKSMLWQLSRIVMDNLELRLQTRLLVKDLQEKLNK